MPALIRIACLLGLALLLNACCASYDPGLGPLDTRAAGDFILYKLDGIGIPGASARGWQAASRLADSRCLSHRRRPTRNRIFAAFDGESIRPPSGAPDCFNHVAIERDRTASGTTG